MTKQGLAQRWKLVKGLRPSMPSASTITSIAKVLMSSFLRVAIIGLSISAAFAAEGATITPAPGFAPPGAPAVSQSHPGMAGHPASMMFPRPQAAFEVEVLTVKPSDAASLTEWVRLASLGYHVVAATPAEGGSVLYLERSSGGMPGAAPLQLPAALEQDKTAAEALRAKLKALQDERQKALMPPQPAVAAPMPAPAMAPATAPAAK